MEEAELVEEPELVEEVEVAREVEEGKDLTLAPEKQKGILYMY